jgi:hypothetical protein
MTFDDLQGALGVLGLGERATLKEIKRMPGRESSLALCRGTG